MVDFFDDNNLLAIRKNKGFERIEKKYNGSIVSIGNLAIKKKISEY